MLVATFVYEEWKKYLHEMSLLSYDEPKTFFWGIFRLLKEFASHNEKLFFDAEAAKLASSSFSARHKLLRGQIAAFILPLCKAKNLENPSFCADFLAECVICWAMENADFDDVYPLLETVITAKQ